MLGEHSLGRFAKCGTDTLLGQIVPRRFRQEAGQGPPLLARVSPQLFQRLSLHLGAEFDHFAHD